MTSGAMLHPRVVVDHLQLTPGSEEHAIAEFPVLENFYHALSAASFIRMSCIFRQLDQSSVLCSFQCHQNVGVIMFFFCDTVIVNWADCGWTCGCAGKTVRSLENTCHTWALLKWWFTKRRYIKCTYLYLYVYLVLWRVPLCTRTTTQCSAKMTGKVSACCCSQWNRTIRTRSAISAWASSQSFTSQVNYLYCLTGILPVLSPMHSQLYCIAFSIVVIIIVITINSVVNAKCYSRWFTCARMLIV